MFHTISSAVITNSPYHKETMDRTDRIAVLLDVIAGIGLLIAAVYTRTTTAGMCSMLAFGGFELAEGSSFLLNSLFKQIKEFVCK